MNQKKQTFNVLFWIRKGRTNEKMSPLSCRVTISGQRYEIPTKLHLRSESWSAVAQKSLGKTANDKEVNRYIEDLKITIEDTIAKIRQKSYPLNIENFKLMFQTQDNEFSTISTLFDYHEIMEKKNLRTSTFIGYHVTKKHLLNFIRIKYHVSDYDLAAVDKAFVYEFYAYLQGYRREGDTVCAVNGALKHIQRFKKVMNVALQNEWISRNPVCLLNAKKTKVERGFLSEKELKSLEEVPLPANLSIVRDVFIFAVYTGLSYVDIGNLTNENINVGIDKSLWLSYYRQKTDIHAILPLLQPAVNILKRYEAYHEGKRNNHIFPVPLNQVMNRYLKKVAKQAGVDKNITFHMARHTYATQTCISQGVPIETLSKLMGHCSIQTTQIYAKITNQKVNEDMKKLFNKVNGKYQVIESDITAEMAHKKFPHWKKINQIFPEKK